MSGILFISLTVNNVAHNVLCLNSDIVLNF